MKNQYYENLNCEIYGNLNDFINDVKQYYHTSRKCKITYCENVMKKIADKNFPMPFDTNGQFTFDEIFHDFISVYLYVWNIGKYENVTICFFDDYAVIYTKNKKYEWIFE